MSGEPIPIDDSEILYRRIPVSKEWYQKGIVYAEAFEPRPEELTGLSLFRKRFKSIEAVSRGLAKQGYFVASLKVADIRAAGISVVPRPETSDGWDDAHVELPELTGNVRGSDSAEEMQSKLAEIAMQLPVEGPFVRTSQ